MPRKKQFVIDEAKEKAMIAFWGQGYNGTSLEDLVQCMGVNRASLYDTFGDKYSLFLDSLATYKMVHIKSYLEQQQKKHTPRQAIINYFLDMILKSEDRNGCLMVNTALELSPHDQKVSRIVNQTFAYIERNFFRKMIKKGQTIGEISEAVVCTTTAQTLLSLLIGLCVLARSDTNKPAMQAIVAQVKALLPLADTRKTLSHQASRTLKNHSRKIQPDIAHVA